MNSEKRAQVDPAEWASVTGSKLRRLVLNPEVCDFTFAHKTAEGGGKALTGSDKTPTLAKNSLGRVACLNGTCMYVDRKQRMAGDESVKLRNEPAKRGRRPLERDLTTKGEHTLGELYKVCEKEFAVLSLRAKTLHMFVSTFS